MSQLQRLLLVIAALTALLCVFVWPPKIVHGTSGQVVPISACTMGNGRVDDECRKLAVTDGSTLIARLGAIVLTGGILFLLAGARPEPAKRSD